MKLSNKRIKLSLAAVAGAACLLGIAAAQSPQGRSEAQRPQLPIAMADVQSRLHERTARIDSSRDGYVAVEEMQAFRAARQQDRTRRRMSRLDTNQDGRISTVEFEKAQLARLERADANRDGQITREELRTMRMGRRADRLERRARALRSPNA